MNVEKPFIVFSTYNNSIAELEKYADGYIIYDQSTIEFWKQKNFALNALARPNVGHSLSNIFEFISENWSALPEKITFLKANVVPRHCDLGYLEANINNGFYSHFYNDGEVSLRSGINELLFPGYYLEVNDSWYMSGGNHSLFCTFDEAARSILQSYKPSRYLLFSPGACFTVTRQQIEKHPLSLYELLRYVVSYRFFPEEAFIVERMLPMIFLGTYESAHNLDELLNTLKLKNDSNVHNCHHRNSMKISERIKKKLKSSNRRNNKI